MFHNQKIFWYRANVFISVMAAIISFTAFMRTQGPVVATVDMSEIISKASQNLVASYPKGEVPKAVLNRLMQHIKATTYAVGKEHNVLILSQHALFSDQRADLTEKIIEKIIQDTVFQGGF